MKILLINYEYPPIGGGAATASRYLAEALVQQGNEVAVLTAAFRDRVGFEKEKGVSVYRVRALRRLADRSNVIEMGTFVAAAWLYAVRIARNHVIQASIVFFTFPCGPLGLYLRKRLGIPYVLSLRGGDVPGFEPELDAIHRALTPIRRHLLEKAQAVVANDAGLAKLSRATDPVPVHVIPNGVDTEFLCPANETAERPFRFLFVGRFQQQKNLFTVLHLFGRLAAQTDRRFEFYLVGDGPQRVGLEAAAAENGIAERCRWHGWLGRESLREVYRSADCLVHYTLYEGMPNAVLEAMACGLPVVASAITGNDTIVEDGKTGVLVSLDDHDRFVSILGQMLCHPEKAVEMGKAGRRRVRLEFTWANVAAQYAGILGGAGPLKPSIGQDT